MCSPGGVKAHPFSEQSPERPEIQNPPKSTNQSGVQSLCFVFCFFFTILYTPSLLRRQSVLHATKRFSSAPCHTVREGKLRIKNMPNPCRHRTTRARGQSERELLPVIWSCLERSFALRVTDNGKLMREPQTPNRLCAELRL